MKRSLALLSVLFCLPLGAQEKPQDEKKLTFNFKDAAVDTVLLYVSKETGWNFVQEKETSGKITAVSSEAVPLSKVLDTLNAALKDKGRVILNPYSPALPQAGQTLKILDISDAMKRNFEIYVGSSADDIPISDQVRTQIVPLKAVNVVDVKKELGSLLESAMGGSSDSVAISTYSNSIILSGRAEGIHRAVRILRTIDVSTSAELKVRLFPLKNADATEAAKILNEVFKKETVSAQTGRSGGMGDLWRMFGGGGGDRGRDSGGPTARALAHEMVRIVAEPRTNSVIVSATDDNMKIIESLVKQLDDKSAAAVELRAYALRYADATAAAKVINDIFAVESSSSQNRDRNRGGGMPFWMPGAQQPSGADSHGAAREVRAVAEVRTNTVIVAATKQNHDLVTSLMMEIDRQVNDIVVVKIYELKNADAIETASILTSLFRPQVNATTNAGSRTSSGGSSGSGSWFSRMIQGSSGDSGRGGPTATLTPGQEIEITSDLRTNSVIVKASREYIAIMDDVVKKLDANPTEKDGTYVVHLKNADALMMAETIQNLLRGQTGQNSMQRNQQGQMMQGQNRGMYNQNQQFMPQQGGRSRSTGLGGGTRGSTGGSTRGRNLGPLEGEPLEQEPPLRPPQEEPPTRGITGTADVAPDASSNSLVIRTSPRNFQAIQAMIDQLDRVRPQVLIKVLIADVTLDEKMQFGVEGFWENQMRVPRDDKARHRTGTDFPLGTAGLLHTLTGDEFSATINALAGEGRLRVMATPRILVLDNQTANINVGKEVPIITNTTINTTTGNPINTINYESVGILLEVTPHINPDGLVTLDVAPEISDVASEAESVIITPGATSPTFNVNSALTTVAVRNGTTIVIGGLIRETTDDAVSKVPILGDIPLLGYLFSHTTKRKVKRELMIFVTPYVAYTASELEEISQLEKAKLKLIDPRDIESESDQWLDRVRK
jgi:general secretion pathway protein D